MKASQWDQIDKVCEYEAAKAVVPIKLGIIATERYRTLYTLCAESKGAVFVAAGAPHTRQGPGLVEVRPRHYD